jgi:hypothetical protein
VLRGAARDRKEDRKRKVTNRRRKGAGREAELDAEADQEADKEEEEEEEEEASADRAAGQPRAQPDVASWTQTGQIPYIKEAINGRIIYEGFWERRSILFCALDKCIEMVGFV